MKRFAEPTAELDACAAEIVAACIEVHEALGPGFLESVYDQALSVEPTSATCCTACDAWF